eukprot:CAMPEP_0181305524 /NCGR_PEP_ID=MMETSP1101-20121128/9780_1 /TAXON_ID=46948 /ORGANISM="Rhodomonas abbreviata, Strain Caron Lab Isolate" /LENGTH=1099 /DNA_ID=CAMNT_0023411455 /DNA_START=102 /DNA_END=3401 /DNA_ORIENTATION=-
MSVATREDFDNLIRALLNQNDTERNVAEQTFEQLCNSPEQAAPLLCGTLLQCPDQAVRALTAVMFRKRVTQAFFAKLSLPTQAAVKQSLLQAVQQEQDNAVRRKIADTTGEIAAMIMGAGDWPEIMPFIFEAAKSPTATLRESSMLIFSRLTFVASEKMVGSLGSLKELLGTALQDPVKEVKLSALNATACMVQALSKFEQHIASLTDMIPAMVSILTAALNEPDEEAARTAIEEFISIAEEAPKFFRKHMDPMIQMAIQIVTAQNLEEETRFLAVELLVTLAEQAPTMMRKQTTFLQNIVPLALQLMLVVEEVDMVEWNSTADDDDDDTELSSLDVGKDCLDRLALSLGGKTVFSLAFREDLVPAFLEHQDWKYRHAALSCISQIAEGCSKQMKEHLEKIIAQIAGRFQDPHPRVRWAAINAMGQLETDLGPDLQNQFHGQVLPALTHVMEDVANPRVQSHAAAAVINFTENCKMEILVPYLDVVLGKLVQLLVGGVRIVQEQAITAIASVADCVEKHFTKYYQEIMPTLKTMLLQCTSKEHRLLRGKTMECISLIGIAVGREVFLADAKEIMDQFQATQSASLDPDDPQASYLLQAWGRVAKALGQDFIPYLNIVMPPLLKSVAIKADVEVQGVDGDEEDEDEQEDIATVMVQTDTGTRKIALKTSALEEKATACTMLVCYFGELQEGMLSWIEPVAELMVPLLSFIYYEEVRTAAAALMPELVKAAMASMQKGLCDVTFVAGLTNLIFDRLIKVVVEEPEEDVQLSMLEALHESITNGGANCLHTPAKVKELLEALKTVMHEVLVRTKERAEAAQKDEDFDEEAAETQAAEAERDDDLLDQCGSALAAVTKTHKDVMAQMFQEYLEVFGALVSSPLPSHRRIGICMFDEVLEGLEGLGQAYMPQLLPALIQYSADVSPEVRQAAVYGLGVCANFGGPQFAPMAPQVMQRIQAMMEEAGSRGEEKVLATDNAVSALGKVIEYQEEAIGDRNAAVAAFLQYLPITGDEEEGVLVHARLCGMLERGEPLVTSEPAKWIPVVMSILARALGTNTVDEAVTMRIKNILTRMQETLPAEVSQAAFGQLPAEEQAKITQLLQS